MFCITQKHKADSQQTNEQVFEHDRRDPVSHTLVRASPHDSITWGERGAGLGAGFSPSSAPPRRSAGPT